MSEFVIYNNDWLPAVVVVDTLNLYDDTTLTAYFVRCVSRGEIVMVNATPLREPKDNRFQWRETTDGFTREFRIYGEYEKYLDIED